LCLFADFFRCEEGQEERAEKNLVKSARKRLSNMHYEERKSLASSSTTPRDLVRKSPRHRQDKMPLTREQFLKVNKKE